MIENNEIIDGNENNEIKRITDNLNKSVNNLLNENIDYNENSISQNEDKENINITEINNEMDKFLKNAKLLTTNIHEAMNFNFDKETKEK
jgi:hypothetical protein